MKWWVALVVLLVGCSKPVPSVPVDNPSMTYLEASKIVEDEERELAEMESLNDQMRQSHADLMAAIEVNTKLSPEERQAEKDETEKRHKEVRSKLKKSIDQKRDDVDRAIRRRNSLRPRN